MKFISFKKNWQTSIKSHVGMQEYQNRESNMEKEEQCWGLMISDLETYYKPIWY